MNEKEFIFKLIDFIATTRIAIDQNDMSSDSLAPWRPISGGEVLNDLQRKFNIAETDIQEYILEIY